MQLSRRDYAVVALLLVCHLRRKFISIFMLRKGGGGPPGTEVHTQGRELATELVEGFAVAR